MIWLVTFSNKINGTCIRQREGVPVTAKVLSANARLGILAGVPAGTLGCNLPNSTLLSPQAFGCVNDFIAKYINALSPLPNNGLIGSGNTGNYLTSGVQAVQDDYGTARVDYKLSDKDSLFASVYRDYSTWAKPGTFDFTTTGYLLPNLSAALEETHTLTLHGQYRPIWMDAIDRHESRNCGA